MDLERLATVQRSLLLDLLLELLELHEAVQVLQVEVRNGRRWIETLQRRDVYRSCCRLVRSRQLCVRHVLAEQLLQF